MQYFFFNALVIEYLYTEVTYYVAEYIFMLLQGKRASISQNLFLFQFHTSMMK